MTELNLIIDHVSLSVEDLGRAKNFYSKALAPLGMEVVGEVTAEQSGSDGHSRLELSRFLTPPVVADHRNAPVNAFGYLRVMFTVEDIDDTLARLRRRGAQLVGEVVQYKDAYRLCYIRGPEGLLIGLAQELG